MSVYLRLRRTFTLNSGTPDTLTLTLKHSDGPISAFLNGELVLTKNAEELPDVDELGFRSFDLSSHIDKLLSSGSNLLALQVSGNLAIPILHGTLPSTAGPFLEVNPRKARLTEGGPGAIVRVSDLTASGSSVSVYLASLDENPLNLSDLQVFHNGLSIPIIDGPSPLFTVRIPTGTNSAEFEIRAIDDDLSEDQKSIGIRTSGAFVPEFGFPITRNGTSVTNANPSDLSLGAVTSVAYDEAAGIYFQLAVIHNHSLWDLTGFQLTTKGLTADVSLYNGTGTNELDVSGGIAAGGFRIVVLQYLADRSNLLIQPQIELGILPDSDLPAPPLPPAQIMRIAFDENLPVSLNIPTESGRNYEVEYSKDLKSWHSAGPIFWAESDHVEWRDSEPKSDGKYYRVKEMN